MLYLDECDLLDLGINWVETVDTIKETVSLFQTDEIVQPLKPYLRYKGVKNRIIAMPAYVGDNFNVSGIKWIASFPDNIYKGIPRANSVVILNNAETGHVKSIINGSLLSIIRTASVSGLVIDMYCKNKKPGKLSLGIIGWGPIGRYHYKMCKEMFGDTIEHTFLYDLDKSVFDGEVIDDPGVSICSDWQKVYLNADIFITCTVSKERYIDILPRKGALLLNVSLRDYKLEVYESIKNAIVVDDWEEVCRENTDIELFHLKRGLQKRDVLGIKEVVFNNVLEHIDGDSPIMVNTMGMAAFDVSLAEYYYKLSVKHGVGREL